jgi:single-strand DNA-binding protein
MAGEPTVSFVGRVAVDPTINFTQTGRAVANYKIAVTPTTKDNDQWVDKDTVWFNVSLWRGAEAAIDTIVKGAIVSVSGKLAEDHYVSKEGEKRTALVVDADVIGLVPRKAKAQSEDTPW